MASGDAKAIPQKNVVLRITIPIMDADGDLVTGATGLDSEISKDGGTFADCTNEATEIATASGMYFLDLTATEMNADTVAVIVKTTTSGAKTTPIVLYTAARSINDLAWPTTTGRSIDVDAAGGVEVGSFQAGAITAAAIATDAIDADALATDAVTEIADGVLSRAISNVEGTAGFRTLGGAIAKLVNKVAIAGATLTVYKTDDATALGTQSVTTDAAADPFTAVDTA